jgi:hypothetical protein
MTTDLIHVTDDITVRATRMDPSIKQRWVSALRSGSYHQGRDFLRCDQSYCCLGVLCDLHARSHALDWCDFGSESGSGRRIYAYDDLEAVLPERVVAWSGLDAQDPVVAHDESLTSITKLNDLKGLSFEQIADLIEEQF